MSKEEILQPLKDHSNEENEVLLEYNDVLKAMDIYAEERCKPLVETLEFALSLIDEKEYGQGETHLNEDYIKIKEALTTYNNSLNQTK